MNKMYFIKLFIKSKFYQLLCLLNIHPLKYYVTSTYLLNKKYKIKKVIDIHKCKLCGKETRHERK